jgi:hypothetical protein
VIAFCSLRENSGAAITIGNSASDRVSTDSFSGQIFLLNANLSSVAGQRVDSWQFFNNNNSNAVTPVLAEDTGGGIFAIRGIGATITGNGSGTQGGAFNLVSGTDVISLNYYLGFFDGSWNGSASTINPGGVEFNSVDDPPVGGQIDSIGTIWIHGVANGSDNPANLGVGALNSRDTTFGAAVDGRHYSINFTAEIVPEPSAAFLGGLAGLCLLRRRR